MRREQSPPSADAELLPTFARGLEGTRRWYLPLRVPQWEDPPVTNRAVSHAAVLFDVAFAASLSHHAYILVSASPRVASTLFSFGIYFLTAAPAVWQWWTISLFLCKFDPGDLVNEVLLVAYMILVVGQASATRAPCGESRADCKPRR